MAIDVQIESQSSILKITCNGTFDADALMAAYERALTSAASEGYDAVLADIRDVTGEPPSTIDRYDGGVQLAKLQRDVGRGIAFALVGKVPIVDPERFAEIVATNRGAHARVFTDLVEAVDWLKNVASKATNRRGWR